MQRVEQRIANDCVFCCIAMILGLTYDELQEIAGPPTNNVGTLDNPSSEQLEYLERLWAICIQRGYVITPREGPGQVEKGKKYILAIEWKDCENGHATFVDETGQEWNPAPDSELVRWTDANVPKIMRGLIEFQKI